MGRADAVYGARQWEGAATKGATDRWRRKALRHGLKLTCGIQIDDVLTGQKVFRKHLVAGLPLVQRGDGVDLELTVKFSRLHADILELPVPFGPPVTQSPSCLDGKRVDTRLGTRAMLSHLGALTRATIGM